MLKRKLFGILGVVFLGLSMMSTPYSTSANDDLKKKVSKEIETYGDKKGTVEVLDKLTDEGQDKLKSRNTFPHLLSRILIPNYMHFAPDGALGSGLVDPRSKDGSLCSRDSSQSLTSHNCDVPNVSGEILGGLTGLIGKKGILGGGRTTAKADYGLGVPAVPTKTVPTDPSNRVIKYTGLELFGYSLPLTQYYGEVDEISVSSSARARSNFGLMDNVHLEGKKIMGAFGGLFDGIGKSFQDGELNPVKWIYNAFEGAFSGGWNVAIDTEELNVIASHGWTRPEFGKTLYNIGVISDKEILENNVEQIYTALAAHLKDVIAKDPKLQEYLGLVEVPKWELKEIKTAKSEKELKDYEKRLAEWERTGKGTEPKPPVIEYVPANKQFEDWIKENKKKFDKTKEIGFSCTDQTDYDKFKACWQQGWANGAQAFKDKAEEISKTLRNSFLITFLQQDNNPTNALSHYVCLNEDGSYKKTANGKYVRALLKNTSPDGEVYKNPACNVSVRPTVKGSYFSANTGPTSSDDGRYVLFRKRFNPIEKFVPGIDIDQTVLAFTRLTTQITNALIDLAYGDILTKLQIDTIVEKMIVALRDSIYFPLMALAVALTAIYALFKVLMSGNVKMAFTTFGFIFIVAILGGALFYQPKNILTVAEKGPAMLDNLVLNTVHGESNNPLCIATGDTNTNALRSLQCEVWQTTIFSPWLENQFGTTYQNLNANNMINQNQALVGDAGVNMGAGNIVNNWAIYQLSLTKSGTITTDDVVKIPGKTDPNLYKLVDLQFGPNNNALSDTRYSESWAGLSRQGTTVAFWSLILAGFVLWTVGGLALDKIKYSILLIFTLMYMPIIFLVSLLPGQQGKFKDYWINVFSILFKRVMVTILLTVLLTSMTTILQHSSLGYMGTSLILLVLLFFFSRFKDELYQKVGLSESGGFTPTQMKDFISRTIPDEFENRFKRMRERAEGTVAGGIGGFAAAWNGLDTDGNKNFFSRNWEKTKRAIGYARVGVEQSSRRLDRFEERKQRKKGFALGQIAEKGYKTTVTHGAKSILKGIGSDAIAKDVIQEADSHRKYKDATHIDETLDQEYGSLLQDTKLQKLLRERSKLLEQLHSEENQKDTNNTLKEDPKNLTNEQIKMIAKKIDEIQSRQLAKEAVFNPITSVNRRERALKEQEKHKQKALAGPAWSPKSQLEQLKKIKEEKGLNILTPKDLQKFKNSQATPEPSKPRYNESSTTMQKSAKKDVFAQNLKNLFTGKPLTSVEKYQEKRNQILENWQKHKRMEEEIKERDRANDILTREKESKENDRKDSFINNQKKK